MGLLSSPVNQLAFTLEPLRKSHYILKVARWDGASIPEIGSNTGHLHISNIGDLINDIGTERYKPFNADYEIPSSKPVSSLLVSIRFLDRKEIYDFFTEWHKKIYNVNRGSIALYNNIVGNGSIEIYGPSEKGSTTPESPSSPIYTIKLLDIWPKTITVNGFDSEDEGLTPASWSVVLSVGGITY
jgi:hypothetical protein